MANRPDSVEELLDRVDILTTWIMQFRHGNPVPAIRLDEADPLARLGNELQRLADALGRQQSEHQQLFDLVEIVEKGVLLQDVLNRVFESFTGIIPYERIGCAFLSEDGACLSAFWARSELGPIQISGGYSQPMAGSSLIDILESGTPRILNDLEAYLERKPHSEATRSIVREGGRSSMTCPLVVENRPIGFLFFTSRNKQAYRPEHQEIYRRIAGQVSIVIEKSRVYQQIVDHSKELIEQGRRLEENASHDDLTGVLNRGAIMTIARRELAEALRKGSQVGMVMVDIDHFKTINDRLGHAAGDDALRQFTRRLAETLPEGVSLGRYGGEEFLLVMRDTTPRALVALAQRMQRTITVTDFALGGKIRRVSASFGCALSSETENDVGKIIAAADRALYMAKNTGRNRVVIENGLERMAQTA